MKGEAVEVTDRNVVASNGLIQDELLSTFEQIFEGRNLEELPDPQEYRK
jgi:hypothetical protein